MLGVSPTALLALGMLGVFPTALLALGMLGVFPTALLALGYAGRFSPLPCSPWVCWAFFPLPCSPWGMLGVFPIAPFGFHAQHVYNLIKYCKLSISGMKGARITVDKNLARPTHVVVTIIQEFLFPNYKWAHEFVELPLMGLGSPPVAVL